MPDSVYRTGLTECEWQCVYSREMNYYVVCRKSPHRGPPGQLRLVSTCPDARASYPGDRGRIARAIPMRWAPGAAVPHFRRLSGAGRGAAANPRPLRRLEITVAIKSSLMAHLLRASAAQKLARIAPGATRRTSRGYLHIAHRALEARPGARRLLTTAHLTHGASTVVDQRAASALPRHVCLA